MSGSNATPRTPAPARAAGAAAALSPLAERMERRDPKGEWERATPEEREALRPIIPDQKRSVRRLFERIDHFRDSDRRFLWEREFKRKFAAQHAEEDARLRAELAAATRRANASKDELRSEIEREWAEERRELETAAQEALIRATAAEEAKAEALAQAVRTATEDRHIRSEAEAVTRAASEKLAAAEEEFRRAKDARVIEYESEVRAKRTAVEAMSREIDSQVRELQAERMRVALERSDSHLWGAAPAEIREHFSWMEEVDRRTEYAVAVLLHRGDRPAAIAKELHVPPARVAEVLQGDGVDGSILEDVRRRMGPRPDGLGDVPARGLAPGSAPTEPAEQEDERLRDSELDAEIRRRLDGHETYRKIHADTGAASGRIARVAKAIRGGSS